MKTRYFAVFAFSLFAFVPTTHAACISDPEAPSVYFETSTGAPCTPQTSGPAITNPGNNPQITNPGTSVTLINPLKGGATLESFLSSILDFVIRIGAIIVVLMLVFVGFKFVMAQGKDSELVEARKMLLWTIVGALILLGAKAIQVAITETVKALSVGG